MDYFSRVAYVFTLVGRMIESDIEKLILNWLNKNGIFAWKCKTMGTYDAKIGGYRKPGKFSLNGVSDILGVLPNGQFLAIEVKTKTGRPSIEQKAFIKKVNKQGGKAFVARSIKDVQNGLDEK